MIKILTTFDSYREALQLVSEMTSAGLRQDLFSISNSGSLSQTARRFKIIFAIVTGAFIACIIPNHSISHLTFGFHLVGLISIRMMTGAATGGAIELLIHRLIPSKTAGGYAVTVEADWETVQKAQLDLQKFYTERNARLLRLVQLYGFEHQSFLSLYDGGQVWFQAEPEAAVVYRRVGKVALVTAAPLAARENWAEATRQFLQYCAAQNLDCLMLPVSSEYASVAQVCGMGILQIGTCGYFKLPEWKPAGDRAKKVRAGVNQARSAGVTVSAYDPNRVVDSLTRVEIDQLCKQWIESREINALGWLLELNPFKLAEHKRYFLARNAEGRLEGMLACSPFAVRCGWYLEDLIRRRDAPRGVSELLVVEALKQLAAEGAEMATLATSPLAGVKPEGQFNGVARLLRFTYEHGESFYHFKQLHRFKTKFAPSFEEAEYVAVWPPRVRMRMLRAAIQIFDSGGLTGMTKAKARKLWHQSGQ